MSRLEEKIKEYQEAFKKKAPQDVQELMLQVTEELKSDDISSEALRTGEDVLPFCLPNAVGKNVILEDELAKYDFVVLNFYRGGWCPYCNLELKALQDILGDLKALNASLIAISPQTPDASLSTKEKNALEFEVLSDWDNTIAKEFGLVFSLDKKLRPIYESFGIDVPGSNDDDSYELPMPATYILNKEGVIIYTFIDEDYTKRLEPQIILDVIKEHTK